MIIARSSKHFKHAELRMLCSSKDLTANLFLLARARRRQNYHYPNQYLTRYAKKHTVQVFVIIDS